VINFKEIIIKNTLQNCKVFFIPNTSENLLIYLTHHSLSSAFRFIFTVSMYEPVEYHAVNVHEKEFVVVRFFMY
jgi:hypothetical protein